MLGVQSDHSKMLEQLSTAINSDDCIGYGSYIMRMPVELKRFTRV